MRKFAAVIFLIAAVALSATADRTTRPKLKVAPTVVEKPSMPTDTLVQVSPDSIVVSGYDKTLRSRRESFFLTNRMATDTVLVVKLRIDYADSKGRELHNRTVTVDCNLAPGETRNFSVSTWDRQSSFYYRRSVAPKRSSGIPYDVKFTVCEAVVSR